MTDRGRRTMWWGVAILLVAAALRLAAGGKIPPGLYHDEAYHGLDVLDMLSGRLSLYFPANNGREPLFIYLIAASVGLLGRSPLALRLAAFPVGILTVAATIALGRTLFSRRVGLLAGATLAVTLWHVHLSRIGFRAVLLPLFVALTAWQVALGCRIGRRRHWLAAGLSYGLSLYTYTAARFTPVALAGLGLYALATHPTFPTQRQLIRGLGLAILTAAVILAPLGIYTLGHWDVVLGRPGQVSITDPAINGGDLWDALLTHTLRTLGMFFIRGDRIWRHNLPWRPIFDPLLGAAFLLGGAIALRRARRDPAAGFILLWTAVMSLPTLLAEDAPHFLRAVGLLPVVAFFPALGLDWLASRASESVGRRMGYLVLIVPLLFGLVSTTRAYFVEYGRDPMAGYWFERGATALAGRINQFLGSGWDGARMQHGQPDPDRQVHLDPLLWAEWQPQLRFLVAAPDQMTTTWPRRPSSAPAVAVFAWPYGDWQRAWPLLPSPAAITVEEGPLSQGDRDPQPFTTYLAFFAVPPDPDPPVTAHFSGGVQLLDVSVEPSVEQPEPSEKPGFLRVRIRWRATAPLTEEYTIFLHYLRDGERLAQADGQPAGGHYPTTQWRPGDVINDDHLVEGVTTPLPGRDTLLFGFWQPESGNRLHLLDEAGNPASDWIEVPVRE